MAMEHDCHFDYLETIKEYTIHYIFYVYVPGNYTSMLIHICRFTFWCEIFNLVTNSYQTESQLRIQGQNHGWMEF